VKPVERLRLSVTVAANEPEDNTGNNTATAETTVNALLCNGLVPTIVGTAENNTLTGTNGNDVIHGLGAMTSSNGGNGNDTLCGGEGNDGYLKKLTERGAASLADRIDQNIRPKTP